VFHIAFAIIELSVILRSTVDQTATMLFGDLRIGKQTAKLSTTYYLSSTVCQINNYIAFCCII